MLREAMYTTIKTLWQKGHNKTEIARMTGHDWKTVSKIIQAIESGKNAPDKKPHPRLLDNYLEEIIQWMEQGLSGVRIHEKLTAQNIQVGYTTVKEQLALIRRKHNIFIRVHTLPGEEAQVDFGYVGRQPDHQGKRRKCWVFNMRLSYSRLDYYEVVYDQRVETFIRCHINAFEYFGGVPNTVKIDNLKAAILEASFYEPIYQRTYLQFANYYGFQSIPCRVYRPNDKGKVESGIKYIKQNFFAGRAFETHQELNTAMFKWLEKANCRIHGTTKKIPLEVFESEERDLLIALPTQPFNLSQVGTRKVYHDCHIYVRNNYYSVPFDYVGKEVEVSITDKLVTVSYESELIATHALLKDRGEFSTQKSHYPKYKCLSETEYQEKYQAKMADIGIYAEQMFFCLMKEKQGSWSRPVQGIIALTKTYSPEVVDRSCQRALAFGAYGYQRIKNICQNGSYLLPLDSSQYSHLQEAH